MKQPGRPGRSWAQMGEIERQGAYARRAVNRAIASGKLVRPGVCSLERPLNEYHSDHIEGHHHKGHDREHWLDVIFLCKRCHAALDTESGRTRFANQDNPDHWIWIEPGEGEYTLEDLRNGLKKLDRDPTENE